jgi:hypothetical protein
MATGADRKIARLEGRERELRRGLELAFEFAMRGRAFPAAEGRRMRAALRKVGGIKLGSWRCGDYVCVSAGALYVVGTASQIAFPFASGCPSVASLGDGSDWQFVGNCRRC